MTQLARPDHGPQRKMPNRCSISCTGRRWRPDGFGFTLIEVLVVVAIIALVTVLAIVGLKRAGQNARDAKRLYDFNRLKLAVVLFEDANGRYPVPNGGSDTSDTHDEWQEQLGADLAPYMKPLPVAPNIEPLVTFRHYWYRGFPNGSTVTLNEEQCVRITGGGFYIRTRLERDSQGLQLLDGGPDHATYEIIGGYQVTGC